MYSLPAATFSNNNPLSIFAVDFEYYNIYKCKNSDWLSKVNGTNEKVVVSIIPELFVEI